MQVLKVLVIGMAVLIFAGLGFLGWALVGKAKGPATAAGGPAMFGTVALELPAECEIVGVTGAEGRLFVQASGHDEYSATCDRVVVLDAQSGRRLGVIVGGRPP